MLSDCQSKLSETDDEPISLSDMSKVCVARALSRYIVGFKLTSSLALIQWPCFLNLR